MTPQYQHGSVNGAKEDGLTNMRNLRLEAGHLVMRNEPENLTNISMGLSKRGDLLYRAFRLF